MLPGALFSSTARDLIARPENNALAPLAMLDLSASGYLLVAIDRSGALKNALRLLNPRCGAGSGINLDRVLQKLALTREEVDPLLADYLGDAGREQRDAVSVRADRCGVFAFVKQLEQGLHSKRHVTAGESPSEMRSLDQLSADEPSNRGNRRHLPADAVGQPPGLRGAARRRLHLHRQL